MNRSVCDAVVEITQVLIIGGIVCYALEKNKLPLLEYDLETQKVRFGIIDERFLRKTSNNVIDLTSCNKIDSDQDAVS